MLGNRQYLSDRQFISKSLDTGIWENEIAYKPKLLTSTYTFLRKKQVIPNW